MSSGDPSINVIQPKTNSPSTESKDSAAPLLKSKNFSLPTSAGQFSEPHDSDPSTKHRKRDFWKFKKQDEEKQQQQKGTSVAESSPRIGLSPASPTDAKSPDPLAGPISPGRSLPYALPASPSIGMQSSRPQSPASSMIFERNVQEDVVLPETSPHLPSHVIMENHIAPALDASAAAITNEKLDPDTVEIVTHATHQPAAVTITGVGQDHSLTSSLTEDFPHNLRQEPDEGSNYGSLDQTDVRRLSFISFADVVHGEQEQVDGRRDSAHLSGHHGLVAPRSPSPIRSPTSSAAFGTSPPTSVTASVKGFETSPHRAPRGTGSPLPGQSSPLAIGSEINVETMRQALRKTGSGDLSHFRSPPASAIGNEDGTYDRPFR